VNERSPPESLTDCNESRSYRAYEKAEQRIFSRGSADSSLNMDSTSSAPLACECRM